MTIRIEVTGDSLPEIADKLLALASQFRVTPAAADAADTKPSKAKPAKKAEPKAEVAEEAQVDPTPGPKSAPVAEETESQPTTPEPSSTPAPAPSASELDFEKDVAPVVIEAVQKIGREGVSAVLSEFGVERASEVAADLWPELVAKLKDVG